MQSVSSLSPLRRPCSLDVDDGDRVDQRAYNATVLSSVDRLLADIAFQRQRERQRVTTGVGHRRRRCRSRHRHRKAGHRAEGTTLADAIDGGPTTYDEVDDEAASAYWWTDVFLRYFVFDDDYTRTDTTADSDDLLFFVRRRRERHKCHELRPSSQKQQQQQQQLQQKQQQQQQQKLHQQEQKLQQQEQKSQQQEQKSKQQKQKSQQSQERRIVYETRAYRKQQPQQKPTTMLPIGDPAILWPHTVCLNAIVHRFRYTLTVAVCVRVPRKSATAAGVGYCCNNDQELEFDDGQDQEYDLQLLSRHVHTVYASTSGRRMDAAKGPRERPVYPAVCWAVDDYAEAFSTVIVRPGQTVCAELVAAWPGSTTVTEKYVDGPDDGCDGDCDQDGGENHLRGRQTRAAVKLQQKQNRAVIFAGAVPYAAVRAAYECKMSMYREAESQRRRRRQQQRKRGDGKKSSLGAALSASLTALFTGGKDPAASDCGDSGYYYGTVSANAADRVEYVTVRGCRAEQRDGDDSEDCGDGELSSGDECRGNIDLDDISTTGNAHGRTKGLAQMAVALAPTQREETATSCYDSAGEFQLHQSYCSDVEDSGGDAVYYYDNNVHDDAAADYTPTINYDGTDDNMTPVDYHQHNQQMESSSQLFNAGTTASEPGDYYDYGWDYETAVSSGQQTPQTPSYHYQLQQQQQLERQKRRGGRPRRLSDPCSTSVFDLSDGECDDGDGPQYQNSKNQYTTHHYSSRHVSGCHRKHFNHQQLQQKQLNSYGGTIAAVVTPGRVGMVQYPYRAWSESEGLNRCGGEYTGQPKQQKMLLLPPPPVPYYCAAEAATSGFMQFVRKSPSNWWTRIKHRRRKRRNRKKKRRNGQQNNKSTVVVNRRRSTSAGDRGNKSDYSATTTTVAEKYNDSDNDDASGSNSDDNGSNSEDQDSDGEFIGALAAAAALGHNSNNEWTYRRTAGDPLGDWNPCKSDSNSDNDDGDLLEWTTEIMATDLRHKQPFRNWNTAAVPPRTTMLYDDFSWYVRSTPPTQSFSANIHQQYQHQHQQLTRTSRQNQRQRRQPPPQLQPQPLEPPPPPPALSVAFTAVACPWWTVLEDVLLVSTTATSERPSSSNKSAASLPLLTFD